MKFLLRYILPFLALPLLAQPKNLVLNPGFELFKPGKTHPPCAYGITSTAFNTPLTGWNTFPDCTPDLVVWKPGASGATCHFPKPHGGEHCVGIITFLPGEDMGRSWDFHEFVQGKLSAPLVPGKEYTFECYVQQADSVGVRHIRQLYHMLKTLEVIPLASGH